MKQETVSVILPVYKPDAGFLTLLSRLMAQSIPPEEILIINTEESLFPFTKEQLPEIASVTHISREAFDHGGTRDAAARMANGEILVFLTMDALPADRQLIRELCKPFSDPQVAAVYGRQLPRKDADELERRTRRFNYGTKSLKKTAADVGQMGIKTYFCSNACAAYRRDIYLKEGGFSSPAIFNEDMLFAHRLITDGYAVYYNADAKVLHSHHYSAKQQLKRNFDLGVSQADHPEVFAAVPAEGEGAAMVKAIAGGLIRSGKGYLLPKLFVHSGAKYVGYRLGKSYRHLPEMLIRHLTMNPGYWEVQ